MHRKKRKSGLDPEWDAVHHAIRNLSPCDEFNNDAPIDKFMAHTNAGCQQCRDWYERTEVKLAMVKDLKQRRN